MKQENFGKYVKGKKVKKQSVKATNIIPLRPSEEDEKLLLIRARDGDSNAETALYRQNADKVTGILINILGFRSDIADIVQEVFFIAFNKIDVVRYDASFSSWVTSIAVNKARHAIRSSARKRWLIFLPPTDLNLEPADEDNSSQREAVHSTYAILNKLKSEERIVFSLRFIEGMQLKEMAESCGISLSTVKRRLKASREKFLNYAKNDRHLIMWVEGDKS